MRLEYNQNLRLEQRLTQSPQMIQAMQILQLTTPELLDRIEAELEDNPFLERAEDPPEREEELEREDPDYEPDLTEMPELGDLDNLLEGPSSTRQRSGSAEESSYDAVQELAAPELHTAESVLAELRVRDTPPELIRDAELLLAFLDPRGYLTGGIEEVEEVTGVPGEELQAALQRLREVAHPALGARDLRECFLLQLDAMPEQDYVARKILTDYFEDLLANRIPQIAKAEDLPVEDVRHAIEVLALCDSRPLADFEPDNNRVIHPDVIVDDDGHDGFEVRLAGEDMPEVRLTRKAHEILEHARDDKRLHAFLMRKIERARWFLDAVNQRRQTLLRIARELVARQHDFLAYGRERMEPLKMQEVADVVGVHISTVSRAIRGKHAQTPQGILPLKGFFSGGQRTSRGGARSRVAIHERIREIVSAEDKAHPLSDEEIVRILRDRDGTKVARRTVTKYRMAMDIPSSTMRREH